MSKPRVAIIVGSKSDLPFLPEGERLLTRLGIDSRVIVASAHRQPQKVRNIARTAETKGYEVLIAAAGYAAHLAGVLAAGTTLPVIGVPLDTSPLKGMDALLSMAQMPAGVPVATVTVGRSGVKNAAVLAARILALKYPPVKEAIQQYRKELAKG
jgi:phosphoribosylaminoimidazole carboxylase PurE protein